MKKYKIFLFTILLLMCSISSFSHRLNSLSAGSYTSLFIDRNKIVWSWEGRGDKPRIVFENATSVYAAEYCSFALREDCSVWDLFNENFPKKVFEGASALGIGADGFEPYVIKTDGSVWGLFPHRLILDSAEQVVMGEKHALALVRTDPAINGVKSSQLMAWGSGNDYWRLGEYGRAYIRYRTIGDPGEDAEPSASELIADYGENYYLYDNEYHDIPVPINPWKGDSDYYIEECGESVKNGLNIIKISASGVSSYALTGDGSVWGWPIDRYVYSRNRVYWDYSLVKIEEMDNVVDISAGGPGVLALRDDGSLWGRNWHFFSTFQPVDLIGLGSDGDELSQWIFILDDVQEMTAGMHHGIALKKDGTVWTWGDDKDIHTTPIQVVFPSSEETAIQLKKFREKMKAEKQQSENLE